MAIKDAVKVISRNPCCLLNDGTGFPPPYGVPAVGSSLVTAAPDGPMVQLQHLTKSYLAFNGVAFVMRNIFWHSSYFRGQSGDMSN